MRARHFCAGLGIVVFTLVGCRRGDPPASSEKAVLNQLRQLSAAADQYMMETGAKAVRFDELVGPTLYIKEVRPIAGEDYAKLSFQPRGTLRVRLADGRWIEYRSPTSSDWSTR